MPEKLTAADIAEALDDSARMGKERDVPEGACYIQISDTLAKQMSKALREVSEGG